MAIGSKFQMPNLNALEIIDRICVTKAKLLPSNNILQVILTLINIANPRVNYFFFYLSAYPVSYRYVGGCYAKSLSFKKQLLSRKALTQHKLDSVCIIYSRKIDLVCDLIIL